MLPTGRSSGPPSAWLWQSVWWTTTLPDGRLLRLMVGVRTTTPSNGRPLQPPVGVADGLTVGLADSTRPTTRPSATPTGGRSGRLHPERWAEWLSAGAVQADGGRMAWQTTDIRRKPMISNAFASTSNGRPTSRQPYYRLALHILPYASLSYIAICVTI
jgi:hypothetical protein